MAKKKKEKDQRKLILKNEIENIKKSNSNEKINKNEKKEKENKKENIKREEDKKLLLNKLKKDLLYNFKKNIKKKTEKKFKENVQKKIDVLQSKGYNLNELINNLDNLDNILSDEKDKKVNKMNINNKRNLIRELMLKTNESKKRINNLGHNTYNQGRRLFTSFSNINVLYQNNNKKIKSPLRTVKSKINTFEFIKKIKKRISPEKKIKFFTNIINNNENNEDENENNLEHNKFKNIINNYIKIKRKERKDNEIKNKERISKENFKKYENFIKLQENIKDSMLNDVNKKKDEEEEKENGKIELFDNTNKSSVFNEQEYYINCYEAQKIFKSNDNNENIINNFNLKNQLSKSIEYHINLNKIRNKNIQSKSKIEKNIFDSNDFEQIEKALKNNNELFNKIHINNLLKKQKNGNNKKYKIFIEKIFLILNLIIKRKYFELLKLNINTVNIILKTFLKNITKIIKYYPFYIIKKYCNNKKNIIKLKKIIYNIFLKKYFHKIKLLAKNEKCNDFYYKIINIYLKKYFNIFINQLGNIIKDKKNKDLIDIKDNKQNDNNNLIRDKVDNNLINKNEKKINDENDNANNFYFKEKENNKLKNNENNINIENLSNKNILLNENDLKDKNKSLSEKDINNKNINKNESIQLIVEDNKNKIINKDKDKNENNKKENVNIFLNNAFFHNKEIFKNLRYEDEDDFFNEDSNIKEDNKLDKEININNLDNKKEDKKIKEDSNEIEQLLNKIPKNIKENIENELTEQILKEILDIEINNKEKIIKKKLPISEYENKQKEIISNKNNVSSNNNSQQLESSIDNSINTSILKKSIGEIKEGRKLNKYSQKKFPIFLKMIENDIKKNYNEIVNNLKEPLIINEEKYLNEIGNLLNDKNNNDNIFDFNNEINEDEIIQKKSFLYKFNIPYFNKNVKNKKFIDEKVLNEFNIKNELMNNKSNEDTFNVSKYDICLNKCVYDSANEIIEKKRMYGDLGKPLLWSSRNKIITYNYDNTEYSKKIFIKEIMNELKKTINKKIGLIPENYDYMSLEHLISDREKKFIQNIHNDLLENEEKDNNLDLIFTAFLMNISKIIMDQLLEEVIQILNLVEQSRKDPSKFESKSIYAYDNEDIPIYNISGKNDDEDDNFLFQ